MKLSGKWALAAAAAIFLGLYIALAWMQKDFLLPDFDYRGKWGFLWHGLPDGNSNLKYGKSSSFFLRRCSERQRWPKAGVRISFPAIFRGRLFMGALLLAAAILLILSVRFLFHGTEVTDDENTYDFQAKTLLAGRLVNPPPPVISNFNNEFLINDGSCWVGTYTLGHPLVIAFGMMLGSRYIGTIVLSIMTLLLVYGIAKELFPDKEGGASDTLPGPTPPFFIWFRLRS